jgi:hypothetical protein
MSEVLRTGSGLSPRAFSSMKDWTVIALPRRRERVRGALPLAPVSSRASRAG